MTNIRSLALAAVAAVLALGAACGGGDGGAHTPGATSTVASARTPATTVAEATSGGSPAVASPVPEAASTPPSIETSVAVTLVDYSVSADKANVPAGTVRFIATNTSAKQVHEFAVLKFKPDGSFDKVGEIKDIEPEKGGSIALELAPGAYQLACLITIGESGSTVDHYQQGMHTPFTVR